MATISNKDKEILKNFIRSKLVENCQQISIDPSDKIEVLKFLDKKKISIDNAVVEVTNIDIDYDKISNIVIDKINAKIQDTIPLISEIDNSNINIESIPIIEDISKGEVGPQGDKGDTGPIGPIGPEGKPGSSITTKEILDTLYKDNTLIDILLGNEDFINKLKVIVGTPSNWKLPGGGLGIGDVISLIQQYAPISSGSPSPISGSYVSSINGLTGNLFLSGIGSTIVNQVGNTIIISGANSTVSGANTLSSLLDVNVSGVHKNDVLKWNGYLWVPAVYNASFTFAIASFTTNIGATTIEIGNGIWKNIGSIIFNAAYSNGPAINGYISHVGWTNLTMNGTSFTGPTSNISADSYPAVGGTKTYTLNATDGTDTPIASLSYTFYNNLYWGISTNTIYTSADVVGLATKALANSRVLTFTVSPGVGQYIVYAYPSRLGLATFTVGGFSGGFDAVQVVSVINGSGYIENYNVYKSSNANLGTTTVIVS